MSQENVLVLQRAVDHFNETGAPPWDLIDPEITFTTWGEVGGRKTYTGIEGFRDAMSMFRGVWKTIRWEIQGIHGSGDRLVVDFRFHLSGKRSELQVDEAWAIWMGDGKFLRIEQYLGRGQALEAAGLSE